MKLTLAWSLTSLMDIHTCPPMGKPRHRETRWAPMDRSAGRISVDRRLTGPTETVQAESLSAA